MRRQRLDLALDLLVAGAYFAVLLGLYVVPLVGLARGMYETVQVEGLL